MVFAACLFVFPDRPRLELPSLAVLPRRLPHSCQVLRSPLPAGRAGQGGQALLRALRRQPGGRPRPALHRHRRVRRHRVILHEGQGRLQVKTKILT